MPIRIQSIFLVIALVFSSSLDARTAIALQGGDYVGNGGDVIVCENSKVPSPSSIELLDLFEARTIYGKKINMPKHLSLDETLKILTDRLGYFDPYLSQFFKGNIDQFMSETVFVKGVVLTDIPDSKHIALAQNCRLEQIAIQRTPRFPGEKRYTISKNLWDQLDSLNQAALILHEVLYRQVLESNIESPDKIDSEAVRYLVHLLVSNSINELSFEEFYSLMVDHFGIHFSFWNGYVVKNLKFDGDPNIPSRYEVSFFERENLYLPWGERIVMTNGAKVHFEESKTHFVLDIKDLKDSTIKISNWKISSATYLKVDYKKKTDQLIFTTDGTLKLFHFLTGTMKELQCDQFQIQTRNSKTILCKDTYVDFFKEDFYRYPLDFDKDAFRYDISINTNHRALRAESYVTYKDTQLRGVEIFFSKSGTPKEVICRNDSFFVKDKMGKRHECRSGGLGDEGYKDLIDLAKIPLI